MIPAKTDRLPFCDRDCCAVCRVASGDSLPMDGHFSSDGWQRPRTGTSVLSSGLPEGARSVAPGSLKRPARWTRSPRVSRYSVDFAVNRRFYCRSFWESSPPMGALPRVLHAMAELKRRGGVPADRLRPAASAAAESACARAAAPSTGPRFSQRHAKTRKYTVPRRHIRGLNTGMPAGWIPARRRGSHRPRAHPRPPGSFHRCEEGTRGQDERHLPGIGIHHATEAVELHFGHEIKMVRKSRAPARARPE